MKSIQEQEPATGSTTPTESTKPVYQWWIITYRIDAEDFSSRVWAFSQTDALEQFYDVDRNPELRITGIETCESPDGWQGVFHVQYGNDRGLWQIDKVMSHDYITAGSLEEAEELFWFKHGRNLDQEQYRFLELHSISEVGVLGKNFFFDPPKKSPFGFAPENQRGAYDFWYKDVFTLDSEPGRSFLVMADNLAEAEAKFWDHIDKTGDPIVMEQALYKIVTPTGTILPVDPPRTLPNPKRPDHIPPTPATPGHPQCYGLPENIMVMGCPPMIRGVFAIGQIFIDDGGMNGRTGEFHRYADAIQQIVHHSMEHFIEHGAPVTRFEDSQLYGYARDAAMFFRFLADGDNGCWKETDLVSAVMPEFDDRKWGFIRRVQPIF